MENLKLIIFGAGGHYRSCVDVVVEHGKYQIAGIIDRPNQKPVNLLGYSVIGSDQNAKELAEKFRYAIIGVGQIKSPDIRIHLFRKAIEYGFIMPTIISPRAYVSRYATIGSGTVVMHGAVINAGANIGENCIINSCSLLEHDVIIGDHCHISTGALINGGVSVGDGTFVGSGSVVRESLQIGKKCLIGMGSSILRNVSDNSIIGFKPL